jgi:hypothetical protein
VLRSEIEANDEKINEQKVLVENMKASLQQEKVQKKKLIQVKTNFQH